MSILSRQEKAELFAKLDAIGEAKARENLAQKVYGTSKTALVNEWLRKQEETRNQEKSDLESSFKEQELSETKEANRVAREANEFARAANDISLSASEEAKESNRIAREANSSANEAIRVARQNKNIAIAAFIISSVTAIVAIIIFLYKK